MNPLKNPKRSLSHRGLSYPAEVYVREIKKYWLKERPKVTLSISTGESRMVYRMTLGSLYYDTEIKKYEARESESEIGQQSIIFLKSNYPALWRKWLIAKNDTNNHLCYIVTLWKQFILDPVDKLISELKLRFPGLVKYIDIRNKNEFYVEENIKEGVYLEIQHYATVGYRLDLFQIGGNNNKVGNAYTFVMSSNRQALEYFIDSMSKLISDERTLNQFKRAEEKKSEIESKVYEFKKDLDDISQ
jgi:hypothetical protein